MKYSIILFLFLTLPLFAQTSISLEEAINKAKENNLKLQVDKLDYQSAQFAEKAVLALPKTNINGLFGQTNSMRFDENISITQDIPNPGFIRAQKEEARQEAKLYAINSDISLREIKLGLSQSWHLVQRLGWGKLFGSWWSWPASGVKIFDPIRCAFPKLFRCWS